MKPAAIDNLDVTSVPQHRESVTVRTPSRARDFYELTKPRMNFLVVVTTLVGFYMAAGDAMQWMLLLNTLLGTALCAAGASVLNQFVERELDARMHRTRNRPLPAGRISPREAVVMGAFFGICGVAYLATTVNVLTAILGGFTLASYVWIYTPLKRLSTLNTVIGAIPGAIPPVMGWTAVRGGLSPEAIALFGILFLWQMPHFLAIATLYRDDYARAGFRMLPCVDQSLTCTGRQIVLYGLALLPVSLMPANLHMAGAVYFTAAMLMGLAYLSFGVSCAISRERVDARKLFIASIVYLPLLLAVMMLDKI